TIIARERSQTDEQRAEAIISARLKQLGWGEADLHAAQERPKEGRACQSPALANHDELEMDSPALRNGITDPRLQSSSPIKRILCLKVRTDPISALIESSKL